MTVTPQHHSRRESVTLLAIMYGGITSIDISSICFRHSIVMKSPARGDFTIAANQQPRM